MPPLDLVRAENLDVEPVAPGLRARRLQAEGDGQHLARAHGRLRRRYVDGLDKVGQAGVEPAALDLEGRREPVHLAEVLAGAHVVGVGLSVEDDLGVLRRLGGGAAVLEEAQVPDRAVAEEGRLALAEAALRRADGNAGLHVGHRKQALEERPERLGPLVVASLAVAGDREVQEDGAALADLVDDEDRGLAGPPAGACAVEHDVRVNGQPRQGHARGRLADGLGELAFRVALELDLAVAALDGEQLVEQARRLEPAVVVGDGGPQVGDERSARAHEGLDCLGLRGRYGLRIGQDEHTKARVRDAVLLDLGVGAAGVLEAHVLEQRIPLAPGAVEHAEARVGGAGVEARLRVVDGDGVVQPLRVHQGLADAGLELADLLDGGREIGVLRHAWRHGVHRAGRQPVVDGIPPHAVEAVERGAPGEEARVVLVLLPRVAPVPQAEHRARPGERADVLPFVGLVEVDVAQVEDRHEPPPVVAAVAGRAEGAVEADTRGRVGTADGLPGPRHHAGVDELHVPPVIDPARDLPLRLRVGEGDGLGLVEALVRRAPRGVELGDRLVLGAKPLAQVGRAGGRGAHVHVAPGQEALVAEGVALRVEGHLASRDLLEAGQVLRQELRVGEARLPQGVRAVVAVAGHVRDVPEALLGGEPGLERVPARVREGVHPRLPELVEH